MVSQELRDRLDEEIKKRKALIVSFPKVIQERARSMGFSQKEIEEEILN